MQKNKYIIGNIKTVLSNKFLQIFLIIALLVIGYFTSTLDRENGYFVAISKALTFQQFITLCFLPMILFANLLIVNLYERNNMLIIRFNNKRKYINEMIKNVLFCNTFLFFISMLVIITFFNFFGSGDFSIIYIESFKTTNIVFAIYTVIKLYILSIFVSIIFTLILKLINKLWAIILFVCFSSSLYICYWESYNMVESIFKIPFYFGFYFLNNVEYITFTLNIMAFVVNVLILSLITVLLYKLTIKRMKVVGE